MQDDVEMAERCQSRTFSGRGDHPAGISCTLTIWAYDRGKTYDELLLIRADASVAIGTGHVMRCLALAESWQDAGGGVTFAMAEIPPSLRARLESERARIASLGSASGTLPDAGETAKLARDLGARWVVVDGYAFHGEYHKSLKNAGLSVLCVDDHGHAGDYQADLVLDQNANASADLYASRGANTRLLLGPRYALLRREFRSEAGRFQREIPQLATRILVTMGGSDPRNLTVNVIEALILLDVADIEAAVVVGGTNPHADALRAAAARSGRNINVLCDVEEMPKWLKWADVAVSAAGSTSWEICFLGLPAILIDFAANQTPLARELHRLGAALHLGSAQAAVPETIAAALKKLMTSRDERTSLSLRASALVDGLGAQRVVSAMCGQDLELRSVEAKDCELLWKWANDPEVRAASFSKEAIAWNEHVTWFSNKLADRNSRMFLALENGVPVGQIRLDRISEGEAEIDISVAPEQRGRGCASRMLVQAAGEAFRDGSTVRLHGFILPTNRASIQAFEKAGFHLAGEADVRRQRAYHYILDFTEKAGA